MYYLDLSKVPHYLLLCVTKEKCPLLLLFDIRDSVQLLSVELHLFVVNLSNLFIAEVY